MNLSDFFSAQTSWHFILHEEENWCSLMGITFVSSDIFFFSWLSLIYFIVWCESNLKLWAGRLEDRCFASIHSNESYLYVLLEGTEGFTCPNLSLCKLDILIWVCSCFYSQWGEGEWDDSSSGNASLLWPQRESVLHFRQLGWGGFSSRLKCLRLNWVARNSLSIPPEVPWDFPPSLQNDVSFS